MLNSNVSIPIFAPPYCAKTKTPSSGVKIWVILAGSNLSSPFRLVPRLNTAKVEMGLDIGAGSAWFAGIGVLVDLSIISVGRTVDPVVIVG